MLMKKAPRGALLVYCVVVFLLAWWPWNVWLVVGSALARGLYRSDKVVWLNTRTENARGVRKIP
jgi:threonine/homoserine/homoserine lactone efflux protein